MNKFNKACCWHGKKKCFRLHELRKQGALGRLWDRGGKTAEEQILVQLQTRDRSGVIPHLRPGQG